SDEVPLELDTADQGATNMGDHNALGFFPAPGFAQNPFRSDPNGNPDPNGNYQCYELLVMTQDYRTAGGPTMGQRRAHGVVSQPGPPNAAIQKAEMLSPFALLTSTNGQPLRGLEPTLTFDGHLFIWQGSPNNDGSIDRIVYSFNQNPGQTGGWSVPRSITD